MKVASATIRSVVAIALALVAAVSLRKAPEYAWGGVTLDGQRYKFTASHIYAIVPPGAIPPAFTGCRWTAPAHKGEICRPTDGGAGAAWMIGFTPIVISLATLLALASAGAVVLGFLHFVGTRAATRLLAAAMSTALVAMVVPFFTVTYAVGALRQGSVFFGALGTDFMLIAIVATACGWQLMRRQPQGQIARSTEAIVAAV